MPKNDARKTVGFIRKYVFTFKTKVKCTFVHVYIDHSEHRIYFYVYKGLKNVVYILFVCFVFRCVTSMVYRPNRSCSDSIPYCSESRTCACIYSWYLCYVAKSNMCLCGSPGGWCDFIPDFGSYSIAFGLHWTFTNCFVAGADVRDLLSRMILKELCYRVIQRKYCNTIERDLKGRKEQE